MHAVVEHADDVSNDMFVNDLFAEMEREMQVDAPAAPTCVCDAILTPFRLSTFGPRGVEVL